MKIGITGSIACGKSTVSSYLREKGYPLADADAVSRRLTAAGGKALPQIRAVFGDDVFQGDELDRKAIAKIVFSDPEEKKKLEAILHPLVRQEIDRFLSENEQTSPIVFADIPLLFECGMQRQFDRIWVISADEETQIARLKERDGMTREEALARIRAQMPLLLKEQQGDVIRTNGTLEETYLRVDELLASVSGKNPAPRRKAAESPRPKPSKPEKHSNSFLSDVPFWMKVLLAALLTVCILLSATLITRNYLAHLEEQRRLEAEAAELAQHPLYYKEDILRYAADNGLDPSLVCAVILCESSFDPNAVSRLGARGLMQLMEDTASWVAHKLGEDDAAYSFDRLFDPETNIRYGCWYLGYLSKRFGGDPVKIICAYHAGQGNVDAWLKNPAYSSDGITLDTIPTKDTAQYCSRVTTAMEVYARRYFAPAESDPADTALPTLQGEKT